MWTCPPAVREAATGIFLRPVRGSNDTVQGHKFKHIEFSRERAPFESYLIVLNLSQQRGFRRFFCYCFK